MMGAVGGWDRGGRICDPGLSRFPVTVTKIIDCGVRIRLQEEREEPARLFQLMIDGTLSSAVSKELGIGDGS
jgi:hypothetical protein